MEINCTEKELFVFKKIAHAAQEMNVPCYVIGGFVRDKILDRPTKDADIVCVGDGIELANKVADRFQPRPAIAIFKNFGTAQIKLSLPPTPSGGGGTQEQSDFWEAPKKWNGLLPLGEKKDIRKIARAITLAEAGTKKEPLYNGSITVNQFKADPFVYTKLKEFALAHRKEATVAESILWDKLRNK